MDIVDYYNWRYATKKFNSKKKVAPSDLELIKEAVRLAPSSYGLQLFKVIIIENQELKKKFQEFARGLIGQKIAVSRYSQTTVFK